MNVIAWSSELQTRQQTYKSKQLYWWLLAQISIGSVILEFFIQFMLPIVRALFSRFISCTEQSFVPTTSKKHVNVSNLISPRNNSILSNNVSKTNMNVSHVYRMKPINTQLLWQHWIYNNKKHVEACCRVRFS